MLGTADVDSLELMCAKVCPIFPFALPPPPPPPAAPATTAVVAVETIGL